MTVGGLTFNSYIFFPFKTVCLIIRVPLSTNGALSPHIKASSVHVIAEIFSTEKLRMQNFQEIVKMTKRICKKKCLKLNHLIEDICPLKLVAHIKNEQIKIDYCQ